MKQTLKNRDDLARVLGVTAPAQVTLRFHPTTDDYESATGRAWFTSASLVNGELHLLPLATLRERGVLERTIRHELVHVMTDSVLDKRPLWVREGAAIYFAVWNTVVYFLNAWSLEQDRTADPPSRGRCSSRAQAASWPTA